MKVVALVGCPNVGKSTFFNRLTKTRDALVADFPGLTRDRKYGRALYEGREYVLIDTGGIAEDATNQPEEVTSRMTNQALLAIDECDFSACSCWTQEQVSYLVTIRLLITFAVLVKSRHYRK